MIFTQARFFAFFALVLVLHWSLRGARARKLWLLIASYAFYACWDWRFLSLLILSSAVDYAAGLAMGRQPERRARRPWLLLSLLTNLAILGFFKYWNFFASSAAELLCALGFSAHAPTLDIVLPVGISFYTFQTMSYALDVHRGRIQPVRDPLDFALYVAFFPQLVAGPIVRATDFLPQLAGPRRFAEHVAPRAALGLFLVGFVKKACVADAIAAEIDPFFAAPAGYTRAASWLGVALYHVQIYCDFSGYSDMAIASAGLLGYRLPVNFAFPYLARGIGEFWRRWHVSLSTWMRDYLYLPLVGARPSTLRRVLALYLSLGLVGLWHGAGWPYVGFGLVHANLVVLEELWKRATRGAGPARRVSSLLGGPLTTLCVALSWPVFRIAELAGTRSLFANLLGHAVPGSETLPARGWWLVAAFTLAHVIAWRGWLGAPLARLPAPLFALGYGLAWALVLPFVAGSVQPFIYFQF